MLVSARLKASRWGRAATGCALALAALAAPTVAVAASGGGGNGSGGAGIGGGSSSSSDSASSNGPSGGGGLFSPTPAKTNAPAPPNQHAKGRWLRSFTITEYWPTPESWFVGKLVSAPGLAGRHRIDWLYSAIGVSMEGEGVGLDGRMYHIDSMGNGGWVTSAGRSTSASSEFAGGSPFWRAGDYWRNSHGGVTFPLLAGGWYNGTGRHYVPLPGVTFAAGASLPLHYLQSIAVDPSVIPLGSRVYIPAYSHDGHGGWFVAQDTGGAINGHRIDVYRQPPSSPNVGGQYLTSQRVYVIKPR
ncbi:MAG TPA: 3D domain-containing protein [Solirubrobacteraceae bacterium]|jgi:3D (Asp-Asp-Asp) domain-containing protein